jgi:hypothetical protein
LSMRMMTLRSSVLNGLPEGGHTCVVSHSGRQGARRSSPETERRSSPETERYDGGARLDGPVCSRPAKPRDIHGNISLTLDTSACFTLDAVSTYCQTLCRAARSAAKTQCSTPMLPSRLLRALRQRSLYACIARQGCGGRGSSKQAMTPPRKRACGRAGGRTGLAKSATHHAAAPPIPVLVARRLDATAVRDPGCSVVWRARLALRAKTPAVTQASSLLTGW